MSKTDENSTYGNYSDTDYRMEVEDTNGYYSSDYEALELEQTGQTTTILTMSSITNATMID